MAEFTLKVSKSQYEMKILALEGLQSKLDTHISNYQAKEKEIDSFIDESDDNVEALRENVRRNIKTCQVAYSECEAAIKSLKETLKDIEDTTTGIGTAFEEASDLAQNTISAAIEAVKLIL